MVSALYVRKQHAIIQYTNSVMFRFHHLPTETMWNLISDVTTAAWRHYAFSLNPASGTTPDDRYSRNIGRLLPLEYPWKLPFTEHYVSPFILTFRYSNKVYSRWIKI